MQWENERLAEDKAGNKRWRRWGPFLSERQWGTVREDYSDHGNSWASFPHDHSRRRAYRWGEDGLQGWTDRQCRMCFAPALWNGNDTILNSRSQFKIPDKMLSFHLQCGLARVEGGNEQ